MLFPKKNSPTETGSSHADAPKSKENNSKKESKVPSITNTDASSTVEAMPELGPYCPISTNKVSSFDSGYDSLSKFDKVMKRPSPHEGKDDETASTKKDSSDSGFNPLEEGRGILGQKIGPPKISARNGKSAIPILVREDYSISTDQDFPPPVKSHILSDEASCISAIPFGLSTIILVIGNHLFPALSMSILVSQANALVVMIAEKKSLTTITVTTITQEKEREGQKE